MKKYECLIGAYAERSESSIFRMTADFEQKSLTITDEMKGLKNPSYIMLDEKRHMLFAACEDEPSGALAAVNIDGENFSILREVLSKGAHTCHLSMTEDGEYLAVANYSAFSAGGGVSLYQISLCGEPFFLQMCTHEGNGPNAERQVYPHPHFVFWDKDILRVCDLGTDRIWAYKLEREQKALLRMEEQDLNFRAGSGPRHLCLSKDRGWLYVCCELEGFVHVFHRENERFVEKQIADSLPEGTTPEFRYVNRTGAIKLTEDEKYLLVTNRGDDSVTLFRVQEDHMLKKCDVVKSGSLDPRELTLFDEFFLVGHQEGCCITAFQIDYIEEKLKKMDMNLEMAVSPVCILNCKI